MSVMPTIEELQELTLSAPDVQTMARYATQLRERAAKVRSRETTDNRRRSLLPTADSRIVAVVKDALALLLQLEEGEGTATGDDARFALSRLQRLPDLAVQLFDPMAEPATEKQLKYLWVLGYRGVKPQTKGEAGKLIAEWKR